jgi:hypothetical protein
MDHTTTREETNNVGVHKYFPYLAHQARYQGIQAASGSEIPWGKISMQNINN